MDQSLLPNNTMPYSKVLEASLSARWQVFASAAESITTAKIASPPASFLPYLVWEYGLGELTPYVPNLYDLIDEGIDWQRVRGTFEAIRLGLGWIGYEAVVEETWYGRNWWNSYQLRFNTLPRNDDPDLERIEAITTLSVPKRSQLRRGVFQYDVEVGVFDNSRFDMAMFDRSSGVRVTPAGTLWSFGRTSEEDRKLTQAEAVALGIWIPPVTGEALRWVDMTFPWVTATFPWATSATVAREILMASFFPLRRIYIVLRDGDGDVIGYRRAKANHAVNTAFEGRYTIGGEQFSPAANGRYVYVEGMTDFEDADGVEAKQVSLLVDPDLADGVPPGRLWLQPNQISGGEEIMKRAVTIPLRKTVREQLKFLVRF